MNARRIWGMMYQSTIIMRRNLFRFFDITLWPLILFLSLTLFVKYLDQGEVILGTVILGVTGWRAVYHAQIEFSQNYMDQYWSGMSGHYLISPITLGESIVANIIVSTLKFTFVATLYFLLAKFLFHHTFVHWHLIIIGLLVLGIFGVILGLITLGICFMYHENAFAVSFILPDLIVLWSGVYYPIDVFPEVMQAIAHFFPTYYGFEILKASVGAGTINIPWLIGTMTLWLVGAVLFLAWAKKYTMKKGLFAKLN